MPLSQAEKHRRALVARMTGEGSPHAASIEQAHNEAFQKHHPLPRRPDGSVSSVFDGEDWFKPTYVSPTGK